MGKIFSRDNSSNGPQDSLEDVVLTPELLAHPLFLRSDDEVLSTFIESLKCVVRPAQDTAGLHRQNKRFDEAILKITTDSRGPGMIMQDFQKVNEANTSSCGKVVPVSEIYFRCLDCEICEESTTSLQCQDCFVNSQHDGHRVLKCKPTEGIIYTCDCGRIDFIKQEAFCSKHKYKEQTLEEALTDFPKTVYTLFLDTFKRSIYGIACLFEISQAATNKRVKLLIDSVAQSYMKRILDSYVFYTTKISKSFNMVFETLMQATFEAPNNLLWHSCEDLTDQDHNKGAVGKQANPCTCSVLGNVLRLSRDYIPEDQTEITRILIECSKEKRFQPFLVKEMLRFSHYIFANPTLDPEDPAQKNSKMIELLQKVLTPEEAEVQYLEILLQTLKRAITHYTLSTTPCCETIIQIGCGLAYFLTKESKASDKILLETNTLNEFLDLLYAFQIKILYPGDIKLGLFEHNVDYPHFDQNLTGEKFLYMSIEHGLKKIEGFPEEKKLALFKNLTRSWLVNFENAKMSQDHQRLFDRKVNYMSGLEKILCPLIMNYVGEITKENVEKFIQEFFPNVYPSALAANTVGGVLNTLGIMRFTDILRKSDVDAFKSYYYTAFGIFEIDIVFLQLMSSIIKPEELFSVFSKNFFSFSQELQDYCTTGVPNVILNNSNSRQMLLAMEDYLKFYIYLMNDEMCMTNLNLREQLQKSGPDFPPERVIKKVIVNLLLQKHWTDVSIVKSVFGGLMLDGVRVPTDATISKLTLKDENDHRIKLKEEYESELDPYLFYKLYYFQREQQNLLATSERQSVKRDLVSGQYYTDLPQYLKSIQQNVFQSELPDFLATLLNTFSPELTHLLHPALKLVLLNLQVMIDLLDNFADNIEGVQEKVKKNYLNRAFSKNLAQLSAQGDFKECEPCIKKIQDLIRDLSSRFFLRQASVDPNAGLAEESLMEQKKRQAKEKRERLQEEFAKKQALFAEKNETLLTSINESPEIKKEAEKLEEENEILCQYCLTKIDVTTDEYGLPVYTEFTNNFYDTQSDPKFKAETHSDLTTARWWPIISSCHHFYHKKCFDSHFVSSRGPQNEASQMFSNEYETQCALCKTLCNNFVCITKTAKGNFDNSWGFAVKAQNLLCNLIEKLLVLVNPKQKKNSADEVSLDDLFKRSYHYFTESFYLYEKSHALEEAFRLHVNCFKAFNDSLRPDEENYTTPGIFNLPTLSGDAEMCHEFTIKADFYELVKGRNKAEPKLSQEGFLKDDHIKQLKLFISSALLKFIHDENTEVLAPKDIIARYKEDKDLRDRFVEKMLFSIQKTLFTYYLNQCVTTNEDYTNSEVLKLLCGAKLNNEDLGLLLKQLQIAETSFDEFIETSFQALEELPEDQAFTTKKELGSVSLKTLKMAPRHLELPKEYTEFNTKFIHEKCTVCKCFNHFLLLNICMICGEKLCAITCNQINQTGVHKPGNLSIHAAQYHMGSAVYFGLDHHGITLTKIPLGLVFDLRGVYIDDLGQNFQHASVRQAFDPQEIPRSLNFSKFHLDPKAQKLMSDIINRHSMGKEIFDKAPTYAQGFADGNRM